MQIKGGIHLKLLSTMIGLIFGLLAILTTVQITYQKRVLEKTLDRRLALMKDILIERGKTLADNLARQAENDIAGFNFSGINESVSKAVEKDPELAYGILMDSSRTAFVHTLHPQQVQETLNGEQDLFAARQAEPVHHEYRENGGDYIEFISPIRTGIQNWGFLRLGYSLHLLNQELVKSRSEIAGQIKAMVFRSIVTSLVFVALGSLVVLWVSARLTRPLLRLSETADALAKGDFSAAEHMEIQSRDEVGVLAKAFTEMSKQLKISYGKLEDYSRTLEQKVEERTRELAAMTERAEAANRTKSQFLSAMSHELRTPLNAIIGYSEMLEEDCEDLGHNDYVPDLRKIHSAGKHLLGLINDILDLSKIEAGRMDLHYEVFDLANTVKSVAGMTQPLSEKNQNIFELKTAKDIGAMNADETRVRQILFNLVSNACKFTEKGTITLDVERRRTEHGDWIHFTVSDTGIGMSPEQMKKLFQSFSQVHTPNQKYGGTGLGLAITRRLCQMMGGSIDVDSSPGRGTTFVVRLPAEPPAEEKAEEAVAGGRRKRRERRFPEARCRRPRHDSGHR
jgi:signal transduction histidine kinase